MKVAEVRSGKLWEWMMKRYLLKNKGKKKKSRIKKPGKLYKLMIKSDKMEAIISELNSSSKSRLYQHEGEELHIVLHGKMEYTVGEKSYKMDEEDIL